MANRGLLKAPGWAEDVRLRLEDLIRAGAGRQLPVVFDFDNTLVCGDIGEATLAILTRDRILQADRLPETLSPTLVKDGNRTLTPESAVDLTDYYEAYLTPTAHGSKDLTPLANGYVWATEIMRGLPLYEVTNATRRVMELSQPMRDIRLEVTPGKTSYPVPFFYPEMVELIAVLLRHRYAVWIVSASNVWSVRWMVLHGLNPLLQQQGLRQGLSPGRVIGVSTLLTDRQGRFYKDAVLVRENPDYATLQNKVMKSLRLTCHLQFPAPTCSGKVGVIWDYIGRRPYLCAGDSPGDHPMLTFGEHRLWIARLEKPNYQKAAKALMRKTGAATWMTQPAHTTKTPGFVSDR